jgi:zinc protease
VIRSLIMALCMTVAVSQAASAAVKIQTVTSPKGIKAWLVEEHSVPVISMDFSFRGGASQDPTRLPGVSNMLSSLLDEGAGDMDSEQFQLRLEEDAIELSFSSQRDAFNGSMKTLAEKRDPAFNMMRLAINEPRLDSDPIERIRAQLLTRLRRDATDPGTIAYEAWAQAAFAGHPYGRRSIGSEDSLKAIGKNELSDFRAKNFARGNLVIAVVGDIDAKTLGPLLDKTFGALPEKADLVAVPETQPRGVGETHIIAQDIPQTTIMFSRPGFKREDSDYIASVVMNHILGGGTFTSRLFTEVREKRGLAYSVSSYLEPLARTGIFGGSLATRNDRAEEAVDLIENEIRRFAKDGPTEDELVKAKMFITGSYPLSFDSSAKISRLLKELQLQNMPVDYIEKRNALINQVTRDDVMRAASRVLGDARLLVVAVGKPEGLEKRKGAVLQPAN